MDYDELLASLTPDIVERLRKAVATGRWPDGRVVTPAQREHSLQAVIAWEAQHLPEEQRVGFIDKGAKGTGARPGAQAGAGEQGAGAEVPLRWEEPGEGGSAGGGEGGSREGENA